MLNKGCKRLFSFAEKPYSKINMYLDNDYKLFIDSGAFSIAHKARRGKNLTIDDYVNFINENTRPQLFASFDVIPIPLNTETAKDSAEQSLYNYLYMLDRIELQGTFDSKFSGGAICHLNMDQEIKDAKVMSDLIEICAKKGVVYFAINL